DTTKRNPKRPKVNHTVQLVKATEQPAVGPAIGEGSGQGSGAGSGSGSATEPPAGCAFPPCDDQTVVEQPRIDIPKPKLVKRMSPRDFGNLRIGGRDDIQPPEHVKRQMIGDQRLRSTGTLEVCVNERGSVSSVRVLASTRYAGYDDALVGAVRGWRYRPHATAGEPLSVCSTVTFIYSIK
ncbi:MAG: energy transducer TonB, partial [Kofleriaceae bacterium]